MSTPQTHRKCDTSMHHGCSEAAPSNFPSGRIVSCGCVLLTATSRKYASSCRIGTAVHAKCKRRKRTVIRPTTTPRKTAPREHQHAHTRGRLVGKWTHVKHDAAELDRAALVYSVRHLERHHQEQRDDRSWKSKRKTREREQRKYWFGGGSDVRSWRHPPSRYDIPAVHDK